MPPVLLTRTGKCINGDQCGLLFVEVFFVSKKLFYRYHSDWRLKHNLFSSPLGIIMLICLYHKITVREDGTATCQTPHATQWNLDTRWKKKKKRRNVHAKTHVDVKVMMEQLWEYSVEYHFISQDPAVARRRPKGQNCLMGCCSSNLEERNGCQSQVWNLF